MKRFLAGIALILLVSVSAFAVTSGEKYKFWSMQYNPCTYGFTFHGATPKNGANMMMQKGLQKSDKGVFIVEGNDKDGYVLRCGRNKNLAVTVKGNSVSEGTDVVLAPYTGAKNQRWYFESGYKVTKKYVNYIVPALNRNYAMTFSDPVLNGEFVRLYKKWDLPRQFWSLQLL